MFSAAVRCALVDQRVSQRDTGISPSQRATGVRALQCDMITIAPKTDLITRLNPKFVSQLLRDHHLPLESNTVSHTAQYNHLAEWNGGALGFSGE